MGKPVNPNLVSKKGNPAWPKAKMSGVTPKSGGHKVGGRGTKSSRGGSVGRTARKSGGY